MTSERATPSVMVVDDDLYVRRFLAAVLEGAGFEVTAARDGFEALRLFEGRGFELVITDQAMPGMRGLELALELRVRRSSQKIFLLTGCVMEWQWKAQSLVDRVFTKPVLASELITAVTEAIPTAAPRPGMEPGIG